MHTRHGGGGGVDNYAEQRVRWCRAILPYPAVAPHPSILPFICASLFQHEKLLVENGGQAKNSEPNPVPFLLELFCQRKG